MSGLLVDVDDELNMPGGMGFIDATDVLEKGAQDMAFGTILNLEGFELTDAMSALEIMDPRMDSGMTEPPPPFIPNQPLLPAEVCWILDRSFACEMSWHTGLALCQTVYTLQYVHHLGDITHPFFTVEGGARLFESPEDPEDPERPLKLVTLVLRACVFGLLKCCDLVWREIAHDHVVDGEDWNSEKFGVSLCENVQPEGLLSLLDEAVTWLQRSPSLSSPWRGPLVHRVLLRKNILQVLFDPSSLTIQDAQEHLSAILAGPSPPEPSAAVRSVFDPTIARRLVSFIPTRVVEMPLQFEVWNAFKKWLDQWYEVRELIGAERLWCVKVHASLRAYENQASQRPTFLRSLSISTFFDGSNILLMHDPPWLVDRFFLETAAIPRGMLARLAEHLSGDDSDSSPTSTSTSSSGSWEAPKQDFDDAPPNASLAVHNNVDLFEKGLAKLLVDYFTSFYHNRARQRRKMAASLLDWHLAFENAADLATSLTATSSSDFALSRVPLCIRHTRLWVITEVVCSGFELELYARHEWTMMYWYLGQVLDTQVTLLDGLKTSLLRDDNGEVDVHNAMIYTSVQRDYVWGLRCFTFAIRSLLCRFPPSKVQIDPIRERANFQKRFKWAYLVGYSEATMLDEDRPVLGNWRRWRNEQDLYDSGLSSALENLLHARDAFLRLSRCKPVDTGAIYCREAYKEFMMGLVKACGTNLSILQNHSDAENANALVWTWEFSRWFPQLERS